MMMRATVLGSCLLLAACVDQPVGLYSPDFGNAVQANVAGQTVNPNAPSDRSALTINGQRAERQQQRYLNDMVERPVDIGTQVTAGGGGGGGGGGTGGGGAGAGAGAGPAQ